MQISRRRALKAFLASGATVVAWPRGGVGAADSREPKPFPGMIIRQHSPRNLEFPLAHLQSWKTPTEHFYVRSHFPVPEIKGTDYRLIVRGHVEKPLALSLADLQEMDVVTRPLTMECAGNGRVHLVPAVRGLQWDCGAVGTADWTGVPLASVLKRAGVKPGAVEVLLVGADQGAISSDPPTPGVIPFDRSIPLEKAYKPEVLLAFRMNGEALTPAHGYPLRAVVGGWYGMASIKWLTRIIVLDRPYQGYFQTMDYSYYVRNDEGLATLVPLSEMQPKAVISRPATGDVVASGQPCEVFGAAWAGESAVAKVEFSSDGGRSWKPAELDRETAPFCWRFWRCVWTAPTTPGPVKLVARATDSRGVSQPESRDPDRRSYMINHLIPVEVLVR